MKDFQFFRTCDARKLSQLISVLIADVDSLNEEDRTICHRVTGVCVPREMYILMHWWPREETLHMALTMLLDDPADHRVTITI
jgi:hypothetical protein